MKALLLGAALTCAAVALPIQVQAQDDDQTQTNTNTPTALQVCAQMAQQEFALARGGGWAVTDKNWMGAPCPPPSHQAGRDDSVPSDWYLALNDGTCEGAEAETPAWVVTFDKGRGIIDDVDRTKDDQGKVVAAEVDQPAGNDMIEVMHFFRTQEGCMQYQQKQGSKLNDLN